MSRRSLVVGLACLLLALLSLCLLLRKKSENNRLAHPDPQTTQSQPAPTSGAVSNEAQTLSVQEVESPFATKEKELRKQALSEFNTLINVLQPYGTSGQVREIYARHSTNRQGGINIEIGVASDTHYAVFGAGPVDASGTHINPFLPAGALLRSFYSINESSDTRGNPEAVNSWYKSTGTWSEAEAVTETFRLMQQLGMPTNQVVRHRYRPSNITVQDPTGGKVRVTPFHTVEMCKNTDDNYSNFLELEYRVDEQPPGRVTRWQSWPPIKVP